MQKPNGKIFFPGAIASGILFMIGKFGISFYIGKSNVGSYIWRRRLSCYIIIVGLLFCYHIIYRR